MTTNFYNLIHYEQRRIYRICQRKTCQREFIARAPAAKYCPDCRELMRIERQAILRQQQRKQAKTA